MLSSFMNGIMELGRFMGSNAGMSYSGVVDASSQPSYSMSALFGDVHTSSVEEMLSEGISIGDPEPSTDITSGDFIDMEVSRTVQSGASHHVQKRNAATYSSDHLVTMAKFGDSRIFLTLDDNGRIGVFVKNSTGLRKAFTFTGNASLSKAQLKLSMDSRDNGGFRVFYEDGGTYKVSCFRFTNDQQCYCGARSQI